MLIKLSRYPLPVVIFLNDKGELINQLTHLVLASGKLVLQKKN